ncbi:MAG: rod shape-determining protein RodA [Saprospiraceae bacterium]|nr:rod shape-determining protein RodA [Saprospiraceae bacterium]
MATKKKTTTYDWLLIAVYFSLVVIGWLMVYASTYDETIPYAFLDYHTEMGRQTIWTFIALVTFMAVMVIEWNFWNTFAYPIYAVSLILLVLVLFLGSEIKGARSWFSLGPGSFQPSEIAKLGTCLAVASYLSFNKHDLKSNKVLMTVIAIFMAPFLLIMLQPDLGSGLVFFSFFILLYRRGLPGIYYVVVLSMIAIFILSFILGPYLVMIFTMLIMFGIFMYTYLPDIRGIGIIAGVCAMTYMAKLSNFEAGIWLTPLIANIVAVALLFIKKNFKVIAGIGGLATMGIAMSWLTKWAFDTFLKPHQQDRINAWLRPDLCDPRGSLYNIIQSKMAIGSGGLDGKGFLNGEMTKLNYVPEQSTDFIFSTIGEEQGFVGTLSVIVLFTILLVRSVMVAERARLEFFRNYAYGVAGIIFIHVFVNIGMTIGLMPVIGIPLPFISKGGSSLVSFTILVAIMIKMDASKNRN